MSLSIAQATLDEGSTGTYNATMLDDDLNPIGSGDLITFTLTYYNLADNKIINSRNAQNILNMNDVTIDGSGNVAWAIQVEDTIIVNDKLVPATKLEQHAALFEWTWGAPVKSSSKSVAIYIKQTGIGIDPHYGTTTEGDLYFDNHLTASEWNDATTAQKTAALVQATRQIDKLNFFNTKTSTTQPFEFPRNSEVNVPDDIRYATYEEALMLLKGFEHEFERQAVSIVKHKFEAEEQRDTSVQPIHVLSGIMSSLAWAYLVPYLKDGLQTNLVKG